MEFVDDEHFQFAELIGEETIKPFAYMLSKALKAGHICISIEQKELDAAVGEMAPDVRRRFVAANVAALQRNTDWVAIDRAHRRPFVVANNKLYIARYFNYETNIISCIKGFLAEEKKVFAERSAALNSLRSAVPKVEVLEGAAADSEEAVDWQMVAGVYGYVNNFTIVTGGPGTGKTTTVAKILNLLYAADPQCKVVLSAPTGKAAMRVLEALRANQNLDAAVQEKVAQMESKTIHSLLGYIPDSPYFKYNSERFLEYDVVIVDEASMIAVALFSKLIAAVDPTKRLILLGDKNQLTSIEAGGLLGDLCNSVPAANRMAGNKKNLFGSLLGNADFIPAACVQEVGAALLTENIVELKRSRRFDDAQGIGQLSKAILQGDAETVQRIIAVGAQTSFVEMDENYSPAFFKRFADQFKAYTQESDPLVALGLFNRVRVLCAVKEGRCGVYDVNKRIERHLSESKCIRMDGVNYHNKPVIVTKNYHKLNLFNGDIGLMRKDAEGNYRVYFMDGNNALRSVLPGLIPEVETVFAMTIHKSQGSEYEQVLVLLPDKHDHQMLSKELVYTAVTRGKAKVWIQGTSEILLQSLQRSVKRVSGVTERINQEKHMSLKVYTTLSKETMAAHLAQHIKETKGSLFVPHYVVTPNNGVKNWLKQQVVDHNAIAVNMQFESATALLGSVYNLLGGHEDDLPLLSAVQMKALLFQLMGEDDFITQFSELKSYFSNDSSKRFALAEQLNTLFSEYQQKIPQTLQDWAAEPQVDYFQAYLWHKLNKAIKGKFKVDAELLQWISIKLESGDAQAVLKEKMPVLYVFDVNVFTETTLTFFKLLGRYVNVHCYVCSPVKEWKNDNNNALLSSFGAVHKHTFGMLQEQQIKVEVLPEKQAEAPFSLLQKIQADIRANRHDDRHELAPADFKDESLLINACYTPSREVEVLYNYLVKRTLTHSDMGARDIVVLCTDIDLYTAAIHGVFSNAPYRFPYHIIDASNKLTASPLNALNALLTIESRWFKPEALMHLLDYTAIAERFSIVDQSLLRTLVNKANIRTAYEGEEQYETHFVSWKHGLQRLLLGFLLGDESEISLDGKTYLPVDGVEGQAATELLHFHYFVKMLQTHLLMQSEVKTMKEWIDYVVLTIDIFVLAPGDLHLRHLTKELADLRSAADLLTESLSFGVFYGSIKGLLQGDSDAERSGRNGITFCSTLPLRAVPFKVVAMLGMNFNAFPRRPVDLSFNYLLPSKNTKYTSVKQQDQFFFLENLLCAKDALYLSYIGKSATDNKSIPPSLALEEVLSYLEAAGADTTAIEAVHLQHPLHSFDSKYFDPLLQQYYTYLGRNQQPKSRTEMPAAAAQPVMAAEVVSPQQFTRFFKDPFKYFYNQHLGVYYKDSEELLGETEVFDLDNIEKWSLKSELAVKGLDERGEAYALHLKEKGLLPLLNLGTIDLQNINEQVGAMRLRYLEDIGGSTAIENTIKVRVQEQGVHVYGSISGVFGDKLMYNNVSNVSKKYSDAQYKIIAFLNFLLLNNVGERVDLHYNSMSAKKIVVVPSSVYSEDVLKHVLMYFAEGKKRIFPFHTLLLSCLANLQADESDEAQIEVINKALSANDYLSEYQRREWATNFYADRENRKSLIESLNYIQEKILNQFNVA